MLEPLPVTLEKMDFPATSPDAIDELAMQLTDGLCQPVMNPEPLFPADHQSPFPEIGQVPGNRRLRQLERLVEVADTNLTARQEIQ